MGQTAARPKNGRPLQNLPRTTHSGFVAAVPSRAFRDGTGIFMVKLSHYRRFRQRPHSPEISLYGSTLLAGAATGDATPSLLGCGTEMSHAAIIAVMKASPALP